MSSGEERQVTMTNVLAYLAAKLSRAGGTPPEEIVNLRKAGCLGADIGAPCPHLQRKKSTPYNFYCAGCGCGQDVDLWKKIELHPYLRCPLNKPGFGQWWTDGNIAGIFIKPEGER